MSSYVNIVFSVFHFKSEADLSLCKSVTQKAKISYSRFCQ